MTGDEPQYLLTAMSIAEDLDLDISDEIASQRWRAFHRVPLDPQTRPLADGSEISPHDPGLALLLALPVAVGGWIGARLAMLAIAAWTAVGTVLLAARHLGVRPQAAAGVVALCFSTLPLLVYSTQIYPEMCAAGVLVWGMLGVAGVRTARDSSGLRDSVSDDATSRGSHFPWWSLSVVVLPWFGVKYVPPAAVLAFFGLYATWRSGRRAAALCCVVFFVVAGCGYLAFHKVVYGGWTAYATGDHFVSGELTVIGTDPEYLGRARRLVGLWVDDWFGLVPWSPQWLALPAALGFVAGAFRRSRDLVAWLVAAIVAVWLVAAFVAVTMHGWWWPSRHISAALPLAVACTAVLVDRSRMWRFGWLILSAVSVANAGFFLWSAVMRDTPIVVDLESVASPLVRAVQPLLPDGTSAAWPDVGWMWAWAIVGIVLAVGAYRSAIDDAPVARRSEADGWSGGSRV